MMLKLLTDLRSSFWFLPAVMVVLAGALALLAIELDSVVGSKALAKYPRLFGAGAEGTRQLLATIAGSTITVAGVVFSITIVALSLAAAQYSPRVLRGFMRDRANQVVLGVFVGVYVYCLLVLRTIRGGEEAFVPGISVLTAFVLALAGIGFLIFFIHHIATSIQISVMAARIAKETIAAMDAKYSEQASRGARDESAAATSGHAAWHVVTAAATGYIQVVDTEQLLNCARAEQRTVRMLRATGDFVIKGEALLSVTGDRPGEEKGRHLNAAYAINTYRDVTQDPAFGVHQLVDIALKALSPGVNDTATARNSLDYLTAILFALARHEVHEHPGYGEKGRLLLIEKDRSFRFFIEAAFSPLRRNSVGNVDMMLHILDAIERVSSAVNSQACLTSLLKELEAIQETVAGASYVAADTTRLTERIEQVGRALGADSA